MRHSADTKFGRVQRANECSVRSEDLISSRECRWCTLVASLVDQNRTAGRTLTRPAAHGLDGPHALQWFDASRIPNGHRFFRVCIHLARSMAVRFHILLLSARHLIFGYTCRVHFGPCTQSPANEVKFLENISLKCAETKKNKKEQQQRTIYSVRRA